MPALDAILARFDRFTAIAERALENGGRYFLLGFSVLYFAGSWFYAGWKPLWFDELLTYYVSNLPDLASIWAALLSGADGQPPLYYLLSRLARWIVSDGDLAVRFPAIVAMWGYSILLFCWTREFIGSRWAPAALLLPSVTVASYYATEARPYSLVLFAGAASLYCWTKATRERERKKWIFALALSLAVGVFSHYYAVLLFLPLAIGEGYRSINREHLDPPVLGAFLAGILPLAILLPLILSYSSFAGAFWARLNLEALLLAYQEQFAAAAPLAAGALCTIVLFLVFARAQPPVRVESAPREHEVAALIGFLLLPAFGFILAIFITKAFLARYVLSAITGAVLLALAMLARVRNGQAGIALSITLIALGSFTRSEVGKVKTSRFPPELPRLDSPILSAEEYRTLPILVAQGYYYLPLFHYLPAATASRLHVIADPAVARLETGADTIDRTLQSLRYWVPVQTHTYGDFLAEYPRFLLFGQPVMVLDGLVDEDVEVLLVGWTGDKPLYLVSRARDSVGEGITRTSIPEAR